MKSVHFVTYSAVDVKRILKYDWNKNGVDQKIANIFFFNFKFNANAATTHTRLNSIEYLELDNDKCERIQ